MSTRDPRPLAVFRYASSRTARDYEGLEFGLYFTGGEDHDAVARAFVPAWQGTLMGLGLAQALRPLFVRPMVGKSIVHGGVEIAGLLTDRTRLTELLCATAVSVGARPRSLGLLNWELPYPHPARSRQAPLPSLVLAWRRSDPAWRPRFEACLEHDVALAAIRNPDLMQEIHLALDPDEEWMLRGVLMYRNARDEEVRLGCGPFDPGRLVAERLVDRGWLEDVFVRQRQYEPAPVLCARRGFKARKVNYSELVPIA